MISDEQVREAAKVLFTAWQDYRLDAVGTRAIEEYLDDIGAKNVNADWIVELWLVSLIGIGNKTPAPQSDLTATQ